MTVESCNYEAARLEALYGYDILDTPTEPAFDELTQLASVLFNAPIAVVNFIDKGRQWFKSEIGLGVRETPLATSFCVHALLEEDVLVIPDAQQDARFSDNPLITSEPYLRFYAGALLKTPDGYPIGTLCVLDTKPRIFANSDQHTLRVLANQVMAQLEARRLWRESERSRAAIARANQLLQDKDRHKDEFLAMLSHELRNPLSPIVATLELLNLKGPFQPEIENGLSTIKRQTEHLVRLVDDLLDASRAGQGKITLSKKELVLTHVVKRATEIVQNAVDAKEQILIINTPVDPIIFWGDEIRMCQVFSNLLTNAARYTPEHGRIELSATVTGEELRVSVSDNGMGIAPAYIDSLFEPFVQAPQNGGSYRGGLGIGLHLCKHIVEMHGGSIEAHSEGLGHGSKFLLTLPLYS